VNFKTATNGHALFSNNNCSVSMHHNFHSVVAMKIRTTGRPRERYKDKMMKYTEKQGEK
jgi:hypothetical protein